MPTLIPLHVSLLTAVLLAAGVFLLYRGRAFWAWVLPCALGWGIPSAFPSRTAPTAAATSSCPSTASSAASSAPGTAGRC